MLAKHAAHGLAHSLAHGLVVPQLALAEPANGPFRRLDGGAYGHTCFSCAAAARQTAKQPTQRGFF